MPSVCDRTDSGHHVPSGVPLVSEPYSKEFLINYSVTIHWLKYVVGPYILVENLNSTGTQDPASILHLPAAPSSPWWGGEQTVVFSIPAWGNHSETLHGPPVILSLEKQSRTQTWHLFSQCCLYWDSSLRAQIAHPSAIYAARSPQGRGMQTLSPGSCSKVT